jgi:hypothetical protein
MLEQSVHKINKVKMSIIVFILYMAVTTMILSGELNRIHAESPSFEYKMTIDVTEGWVAPPCEHEDQSICDRRPPRPPQPVGLVVDKFGFLYAAVYENRKSRVYKYNSEGTRVEVWELDIAGKDIAIDRNSNVYVLSDLTTGIINKYDSSGVLLSSIYLDNTVTYGENIAVENDGSAIYLLDNRLGGQTESIIRKYIFDDITDAYVESEGWMKLGMEPINYIAQYPKGLAVSPNGYIYAGDDGNERLLKFNSDGQLLASFSTVGAGEYIYFSGFAFLDNYIIGSNDTSHKIVVFDTDGNFIDKWGSMGTGQAQFDSPQALTLNSNHTLYVADTANNRIQVFGGPEPEVVPVASITVSGASGATSISNGRTIQMNAAVLPLHATDPTVTWSVYNGTGSATIDATSGLLTATGVGTVNVRASAIDGSGIISDLELNVIPQAQLIVNYDFANSLEDFLSNSELTAFKVSDSNPLHNNATSGFGTSLGDDSSGDMTYWQWTSDRPRGGGFFIDVNSDIRSNYTIGVRFSYNSFAAVWTKIIDYKNMTSDNGFYYNNAHKLTFFPYVGFVGADIINVGQVIDLIATRNDADNKFTVYIVDDGQLKLQFEIVDTNNDAIANVTNGVTRFGFFHDDIVSAGAEATSGGKVYAIKMWDGPITALEAATALNPLPMVETNATSQIGDDRATLNGVVNGNGAEATVSFEFGTDASYGMSIAATTGRTAGAESGKTIASVDMSDLLPNTTYHYRVVGVSSFGTVYGSNQTFSTTDEARPVKEEIEALPAKALVTLGDKTAIELARQNYDALDAEQKTLVGAITWLTEAEQAIEMLEAAQEAQAELVKDEIATLPVSAQVTLGDKAAIELARQHYDALNAEQKVLVGAVTRLTEAEQAIEMLEAAQGAQAELVKDEIASLPVSAQVTLGDKAAIELARQHYDALNAEQKVLVGAITRLTEAEQAIVLLQTPSPEIEPSMPTAPSMPTVPVNISVDVLVNGKAENAGSAAASQVNGQKVMTITVDPVRLRERLESEGNGAVLTIPVSSDSQVVVGELNGEMVKNMEQKQAIVEIRTDIATYALPALEVNIDAISKQVGSTVALADIKVRIKIAEPAEPMVRVVDNAASQGGFTLVIPPMDFTVTAVYGQMTFEVTTFNSYVERTIAIPEGVDPNQITTGVVVEPDGTYRHVPTKIVIIEGKYYAKINSLSNSTYSVVWHPIEFADVANHWAKDAINDMGSRMIVSGMGNDTFKPNQYITRAEFAAILVRGLGLRLEDGEKLFTDVKQSDWYSSAIFTANSYNLISGFEDGTFRPDDTITREQAMIMIARAMKITGLNRQWEEHEIEEVLRSFADANQASEWAKLGVAEVLDAGIVSGRSSTQLSPRASITRAEVAAIVKRLLQASELI